MKETVCGHEKYYAKGLCRKCYEKDLKIRNPEYHERQKENCRSWTAKNHRKKVKYSRQYRQTMSKKHKRKLALKHRFGIDQKQYEKLLKIQNKCCAICGTDKFDKYLCIDHCHSTGVIRGLLCRKCNRMVGFFDGQCNIGRFLMYIKTGGIHPEFWPTYQSGTPIGFHKNSKEGRRVRSLRYNYGIDLCDFNYLLKTQNYRCGLCGVLQEELSYNLCVDHCHKTNKVRGLLCHCCNIALGFIENKKLNIERATLYLNRELGYGLTKSTVLNNRK